MNTSGKIITALVAGAAVGALLGILFAPDKGCETRKKINDQARKLADDLKEKFNDGKAELSNINEEIGQTVKEKMQDFSKHSVFRSVVD